jgi:hypothetical protein
MSTNNTSKINKLLQSFPERTVLLASWLVRQGYSLDLQKRYRRSNWLESIGTGAMKRKGDNITYEGALFAIQNQAKLTIHPGARTALALQGKAHYLELSAKSITLFSAQNEDLPSWFKNYPWGYSVHLYSTNFLPPNLGLTKLEIKNFKLLVSGPARAMLESLYLVPRHHSLLECHEIMEGMNNLRPSKVQELLEQCKSVKVKRMFLYLAERCEHDWVKYIELGKIDLGSGKREIVKGGAYNAKYKITVNRELEGKE